MFQEWLKDYEKLREENNMSEEEKNLVNKIERLINKEEEYCTNEDFKELLNILDKYVELYKTEKEKNIELEHRLKNNVIPKYYIRKMKEEKIQELHNTKKPEIFREILFLNKLLKVKNEEQ